MDNDMLFFLIIFCIILLSFSLTFLDENGVEKIFHLLIKGWCFFDGDQIRLYYINDINLIYEVLLVFG